MTVHSCDLYDIPPSPEFQEATGIHPNRTSGDENSVLDNNAKAMVHSAASAPTLGELAQFFLSGMLDTRLGPQI